MKSFLSGLVCASLLVFAIGCGKDKESSKNNGNYSPYQNMNNLGQVNQQVFQKLQTWYNGTTEGSPVIGPANVVKETKVYNTQPTCKEKEILGFIPFSLCTYSGTPTTSTQNYVVNIVQDGRLINQKGNAELNAIFNGSAGQLMSAVDISPSQSQLTFLRGDGAVVVYGIDRNRNSVLNPEFKRTTSQSQQTDIIIR